MKQYDIKTREVFSVGLEVSTVTVSEAMDTGDLNLQEY